MKELTEKEKKERARRQKNTEYMKRYFREHPEQAEKNRVRARERGRKLLAETKEQRRKEMEQQVF